MKQNRTKPGQGWLLWLIVAALSAAIIFFGNRYASADLNIFQSTGVDVYRAKITQIQDKHQSDDLILRQAGIEEYIIQFEAVLTSGPQKGETVAAKQVLSTIDPAYRLTKQVEAGDSVMLSQPNTEFDPGGPWLFADYYRISKLFILGLAFVFLLLFIGRLKGLSALVSLSLTSAFVFAVFLPWVLGGKNVYVGAALTAVFTIVMSLLLIEGATLKGLVTILGCTIGTGFAALIPFLMNSRLALTGMVDEHSTFLLLLNPDKPIDLVAILYAGIIIGALGAIMDVAMDISSSLYEIRQHAPDIGFWAMLKSGLSISRDIMGTMTNTLVLAYIGSSLCSILLLVTYTATPMELLNREIIIVELLQSLAGSIAILLTAPLTALVASLMYTHKKPAAPTRLAED